MIKSMTGFARAEQSFEWGHMLCEVRSVNHRYLEANYKLPDQLKASETDLRNALKRFAARGKFDVSLHLQAKNTTQSLTLNVPLATQLASLGEQAASLIKNPAKINPLEILNWPDVLQAQSVNQEELQASCVSCFESALEKLVAHRKREGAELAQFITTRLTELKTKICEVKNIFPKIVESYQAKLRKKLSELETETDEARFHQEVVYVLQKYDIAEELDRLEAHCNEIEHVLQNKASVGRRLDFLMQELNREANTLASKSISADTTKISVDLKVLIEQMREQIQNIE